MTVTAALVEPAHHTGPTYSRTFGPDVGELNAMIGFPPDPEQQLLLDDTFAVDAAGKSVSFEVAAIAPRQNLKTGWLKQTTIGWLFVTDQRLVVWSAHEFRTSQEAFRDMENLISGSDMLRRRVKSIYRGNGDEAIELLSGARLIFKARTKGGGRGLTGHKVILDEAFALQPAHMGALMPTLSAVPDPQVLYGSSAGPADAAVLRGIRDRGRAGDPRMAYAEWCAPRGGCLDAACDHGLEREGCALDDMANRQMANPQLGRRIGIDTLQAQRRAMPPQEFAREFLGWWDEASGQLVIPASSWAQCLDLDSQISTAPVFALDVSPNRSWSAIAVSGLREDGRPHVEVTSSAGVVDHRPGTDWVVPRLVDLLERWPDLQVAIAGGSAAEPLVPALTAAGVDVDFVKAGDVFAACGLFYDEATSGNLRHIGQSDLTSALTSARKNVENGETAWRWGRKRSSADITALCAATLALWVVIAATDKSQQAINNVW